MANTITSSADGKYVTLSSIDSDYTLTDSEISDVQFIPGTSGDYVIFKHRTDTGPVILKLHSKDGEPRVKYFKTDAPLFFDFSESSITANTFIIITKF